MWGATLYDMDGDRTKLDMKIARDQLMKDLEPLWDKLFGAVQIAVTKVNEAYGHRLVWNLNDQNSVIRISRSRTLPDQFTSMEETLEIRIDRRERKLVARIDSKNSRQGVAEPGKARAYQIAANQDATTLELAGPGGRFCTVEFAEYEIAEQLLKLKLES